MKVTNYIGDFKNDVKDWFESNPKDFDRSAFLKFVFDYENINLSKDDFIKRKRSKNIVPTDTRCCGKRADGEQCTRKKKDSSDFCGTHIKGTPYGIVKNEVEPVCKPCKKDIWVQDVKGINYFVDSDQNVYFHADVLCNKINPKIIGKINNINGVQTFIEI